MTSMKDMFWNAVAKMQPRDTERQMTAARAAELVDAGEAVLLDVREERELAQGLAEPAQWVATSEIQRNGPAWQKLLADLPRDKIVITYCAAGVRAENVADLLQAEGFRTGNCGGFRDWVAAGLPTRPA